MTELLTRRHMLRGLFAMPAVILTPKLLMPIRAFIILPPPQINDDWREVWTDLDADTRPPLIEVPPQFERWVVKVVMKEGGGRGYTVGLVSEREAEREVAASEAAFPGAHITYFEDLA